MATLRPRTLGRMGQGACRNTPQPSGRKKRQTAGHAEHMQVFDERVVNADFSHEAKGLRPAAGFGAF